MCWGEESLVGRRGEVFGEEIFTTEIAEDAEKNGEICVGGNAHSFPLFFSVISANSSEAGGELAPNDCLEG
jgi:hypothetical protein